MWDALLLILSVLALIVLPAVLILWARDKIGNWRRRETPGQEDARRKAYRNRLLSPKPKEVEAALGALLPRRLVELYSDRTRIIETQVQIFPRDDRSENSALWVGKFLPLDAESQKDLWDLSEFGKVFCFADDGCGNYYWMSLGKDQQVEDGPVFQIFHDGWDNEKVAESLEEFLSWPRKPLQWKSRST